MIVGALKVVLHVADSGSLKSKRKVARSLLDKVKARFNAAAAEVDANDLWQRLELGFTVCGNEIARVQEQMRNIARLIENQGLAEIVDVRMEVMNLKDMAWQTDCRFSEDGDL